MRLYMLVLQSTRKHEMKIVDQQDLSTCYSQTTDPIPVSDSYEYSSGNRAR